MLTAHLNYLSALFITVCCPLEAFAVTADTTPVSETVPQTTAVLQAASDAPPIWNGPFGLEKSLTLETIQTHYPTAPFIVKQPYTYWLPTPPKKDPMFPMIAVTATPKNGVCAVLGNLVEKTGGEKIVRTLFQIVLRLSQQYGDPTTLADGRVTWSLTTSAASIQSILVASDQISEEVTLVSVIYHFDNYDACRKEWGTEDDANTTPEKPDDPI